MKVHNYDLFTAGLIVKAIEPYRELKPLVARFRAPDGTLFEVRILELAGKPAPTAADMKLLRKVRGK